MISNSNVHLFHRCADSGPSRASATGPDLADSLCWELFIEAYGRLLGACIRGAFQRSGKTFTTEDVEEAQQEVYFRLLEKGRRRLRQFRGRQEVQARCFLRRVAQSVVIDTVRRGSAQKRGGEFHLEVACGVVDSGEASFLLDMNSPEVQILRRERWRQILRNCRMIAARSGHGSRNLRILRLALVEGRSSRDISRYLGTKLSVSAIDSVLHRMRRALARKGLLLPAR